MQVKVEPEGEDDLLIAPNIPPDLEIDAEGRVVHVVVVMVVRTPPDPTAEAAGVLTVIVIVRPGEDHDRCSVVNGKDEDEPGAGLNVPEPARHDLGVDTQAEISVSLP